MLRSVPGRFCGQNRAFARSPAAIAPSIIAMSIDVSLGVNGELPPRGTEAVASSGSERRSSSGTDFSAGSATSSSRISLHKLDALVADEHAGPAMSFFASFWLLPQNEHLGIVNRRSPFGFPQSPRRRLEQGGPPRGRSGVRQTTSLPGSPRTRRSAPHGQSRAASIRGATPPERPAGKRRAGRGATARARGSSA